MTLNAFDISIILIYIVAMFSMGISAHKKASANVESYFLGENTIKWYYLGLSNASGMFDISGTMWTVSLLFVYGLKSAWIPWLWPVWNQVFVMVFLAVWMRRSNVMTGAEWILTRFGDGRGGRLSHIIVSVFALIATLGFMAYFFEGIGKFATTIFTWDLSTSFLSNEHSYALIIICITTIYTLIGGIYSVVATEVAQFVIMTITCLIVGYIGYTSTTAEQIQAAVPNGWSDLSFGAQLNLDWSDKLPAVNAKIQKDGFSAFGFLVVMMVAKGVIASLAGPVPSYDMQRILSSRTPSEAAKMSGLTMLVLCAPRYFMIAGFTVLALVYMKPEMLAMGEGVDFERVLPIAIQKFIPDGLKGLLLAGLLAAFMGTFAAFINSAPAYLVNDIYKKYIRPDATPKHYIHLSYAASVAIVVIGVGFGFFSGSLNTLTLWLTSSLYGGYTAANVLKWIWWRFNGYGYFSGMIGGLVGSTALFFYKMQTNDPTPDIYYFPFVFGVALLGCLIGTFLTPPDDPSVLKSFYSRVRPWGFWKPIKQQIAAENPDFKGNKDFGRDVFNVVVGIVWQMAMIVMPLYFMIRDNTSALISFGIFVGTSYLLKKYWWDKLE